MLKATRKWLWDNNLVYIDSSSTDVGHGCSVYTDRYMFFGICYRTVVDFDHPDVG